MAEDDIAVPAEPAGVEAFRGPLPAELRLKRTRSVSLVVAFLVFVLERVFDAVNLMAKLLRRENALRRIGHDRREMRIEEPQQRMRFSVGIEGVAAALKGHGCPPARLKVTVQRASARSRLPFSPGNNRREAALISVVNE